MEINATRWAHMTRKVLLLFTILTCTMNAVNKMTKCRTFSDLFCLLNDAQEITQCDKAVMQ